MSFIKVEGNADSHVGSLSCVTVSFGGASSCHCGDVAIDVLIGWGRVWEVFRNSGTCFVLLLNSGSLDLSYTNVDTSPDLFNGSGHNVKNLSSVAGFQPTTPYVRLLDGMSEALPSSVQRLLEPFKRLTNCATPLV